MAGVARGQAGDGEEVIGTQNVQAHILQHEDEGGTSTHIPLDGPGSYPR